MFTFKSGTLRLRWNTWMHGASRNISPVLRDAVRYTERESGKSPSRTAVLNYLLEVVRRRSEQSTTSYLEIGVRNPSENFALIDATSKYGVDPGLEYPDSKVDFPMTSDEFFKNLSNGSILAPDTRFDVIFIDGLHLADQVDRDISNALKAVEPNGFVVVHDCNPPTEWHARETFTYFDDPDLNPWNGTTWKAFVKWRSNPELHACCIDSDWGIGILSRTIPLGKPLHPSNVFYEYQSFARDRKNMLNLVSYEEFRNLVESHLDKIPLKEG